MIVLSCGIKLSVVRHLVLTQSTRVTDRRTDGRTDGQTELRLPRPPSIAYARAVKMLKNNNIQLYDLTNRIENKRLTVRSTYYMVTVSNV